MENSSDQGKRRPVDPTRHHRENGWDYRGRAIYHFTMVVEGRYPLFGTLEGESAEKAFVRLNSFGHRVYQMLTGLPRFYEAKGFALKVLAFKVMPDHIHLVIQVLEPLPRSIGTVIRGFKSGCTKVYKQEYHLSAENAAEIHEKAPAEPGKVATELGKETAEHLKSPTGQGGRTDRRGEEPTEQGGRTGRRGEEPTEKGGRNEGHEGGTEVLVHFARIFAGRESIWQQDPAHYHERILHAPGQLRRMIDYVKDNPRRLWLKSHNPNLFKLHRQTVVNGLSFTSMGNHFLLDWPDRQMVEMSRSASEVQVEERLQSVLAAAQNGAVTYTAAISKSEKQIARAIREQGFPLVVLLNDGFPKEGLPHERHFKPGGVYFEACAKGQLLLLEPTEKTITDGTIQAAVQQTLQNKTESRHYSYSPLPTTTARYRFVALNEIARQLTK